MSGALTAVLAGIGAAFLWCMAAIGAALLIGPRLRRRGHTASAPAHTRVPGPAPVPGGAYPPSAPPSGPGRHPVRPAPAPGCSLCGWHTGWCGQCGRKVAVRERCPAHEEAPR